VSLPLPGSERPARKAIDCYAARIRRAEQLAARLPFAAEVLNFYAHIAKFQKDSRADFLKIAENAASGLGTRAGIPLSPLVVRFQEFVRFIAAASPLNLRVAAREIAALQVDSLGALLDSYWQNAGKRDQQIGALAQFFPRAFLEPLAELLASFTPAPVATAAYCPLCGSRPLAGVLRPEGDGAKRFLLCSFCLREWEFRRILCPTCGETDEPKLPVYVAETLPHVRVEACDTCHYFLRTIDLTKDGHAVPMVDDLAALPLTLWAQEHHYFRAQPNLLAT
jgi:formate dehydrogenase maturation protein FdhE